MTVTAHREAVHLRVSRGLSQRRACVLLPLPRATCGYQARPARDAERVTPLTELARQPPR